MNQTIIQQLLELQNVYGPEQLAAAAEELLKVKSRPIPSEFIPIIAPQLLADTHSQLDATVADLIDAGHKKENSSNGKKELVQRKATLETAIQLKEAEAFMLVRGEGKEAHAIVDGKTVSLTNDTSRDAYRRHFSRVERESLAEVQSELNAKEIDIIQANDGWLAAKAASESINAKANLQASLLIFLSNRG